jgi:hypothetical protein
MLDCRLWPIKQEASAKLASSAWFKGEVNWEGWVNGLDSPIVGGRY